jgi:UDP-N-acetyl-2-amino-2-deoxyglucuronate dehydrogenase
MINVAIIGTGAIASAHIKAYQLFQNRCKIVAICDIFGKS